ncbi:zinc-dependent alcohol dehydrogenase family protein [Dongia sp.]|uniref:zinc-dependent alcohol dehydrogenase family protein n=1 Tax=Dongia sp. TaxID=1977262 RepID=UPI0035AE6D3D
MAMVLEAPGYALQRQRRTWPMPGTGEVLLRVRACGVCRTDLHIVDGELTSPHLPCIPGHEVIGTVLARGDGVTALAPGDRIGVPWLGFTCGICTQCRAGRENLCEHATFTGYQRDGGYADFMIADARFCLPIPPSYTDEEAAPLLCAGLIGYRALRKAGDGRRLGLYGFGAAAHILIQVARYEGRQVYAFVKPGDPAAMSFARDLGAIWAGPSGTQPPEALDAAIIFAPVGSLVPAALQAVRPGGRVVCAGIHMSDIPSFPYRLLWMEREIVSVANLTRQDGIDFLSLAPKIPVRTQVSAYSLTDANDALAALRLGQIHGAAVLVPDQQ